MDFERFRKYSPIFARTGLGVVFFTFGIMQVFSPEGWVSLFPEFITQYFSDLSFVYINGALDLLIGGFLIAGAYVRIASAVGILHLIGVMLVLGFNTISIRDFGLLLALLSVFFHGPDKLCCMNRPHE